MSETQARITATTDPMVPRVARVRHRQKEIPHTWTLELVPEQDYNFLPGQFNMMYVFGVGEIPISISGDPENEGLVHTIRAVGAVSEAIVKLKPGDCVGIRGPFGNDWPLADARGKDVVIIAGGIGLAPLRPLIYQLFTAPDSYGHISLLYGSRSPEDILFHQQLGLWREKLQVQIEVTVDHAMVNWHGHVGVVTELVKFARFDPANTIAYLCGPEIMMRYSIATLMEAGVPDQAIYLSMERNMKCAIGLCGHCQYGPTFMCKDGPVYRYDRIRPLFAQREY